MHRDKYVYEFIVIMSSLIPGTEGERHRGRRDWPCRTARRVARGWSAGGAGGAGGGGGWRSKLGYFIGNFGESSLEFANRACSIAFKGKLISRHEHVPIRCTDELNENGSKEPWINVTLIRH